MAQTESPGIGPVVNVTDVSSIFEIRNHGLVHVSDNKTTREAFDSDQDELTIRNSGLFDEEFYYQANADVKNAKLDPVKHYIEHGADEGRRPNRSFDTAHYAGIFQNEIASGENPFAHYIRTDGKTVYSTRGMLEDYSYRSVYKAISRMKHLAFFGSTDYVAMNSDVTTSDLCPAQHAVLYGISEGRSVLSRKHIAKTLGKLAQQSPALSAVPSTPLLKKRDFPEKIGVFQHSLGNIFIREIAETLVSQLNDAGLNAILLDETCSIQEKPQFCIFCGPHEFFFLPGSEPWKGDDIVRNSVMFNTEQPQTLWFVRGLLYNLMSSGVIDISFQNLEVFSGAGIPGLFFNPPVNMSSRILSPADQSHAMVRILPPSCRKSSDPKLSFNKREIDVSFFGNHTDRREKFFSRHAEFFADYKCFFYYRRTGGPIADSQRYGILSRLASHVASHSKISLNIHRENDLFFEWQRIVAQGMARGSLVVSEECLPHPYFSAGIHYLSETTRHIPNLVEWLLHSSDGKKEAARIRSNALTKIVNGRQAAEDQNRLLRFISSRWKAISSDH
ncbi:hypothetical protein [Acetobacter oeni]|uniref:hypothetical protein n=1 Tax=Acetobacter oeni TaxID=304077 RepID=UPI0011BD981F|nr:hypothetical protein [Acetobacter oeni]MBB3882743.1 hypothetical protein [Acetobacter oeni]NHO18839.1 hypothetical protein [Acetobacter oeni]